MKKIKVKFMKRPPFGIIIFILECMCCGLVFMISIFAMKFIVSLICILIIVFMYVVCFMSDTYGIRIYNKYIVFRVDGERKKYLLDNIKNIEVRFIKMKKHYKVFVKVHFINTYNKKEFTWDEINIRRLGFVKTKINDSNIEEYISLFESLDKFYVYPIIMI